MAEYAILRTLKEVAANAVEQLAAPSVVALDDPLAGHKLLPTVYELQQWAAGMLAFSLKALAVERSVADRTEKNPALRYMAQSHAPSCGPPNGILELSYRAIGALC
jgi:hypothetical protein